MKSFKIFFLCFNNKFVSFLRFFSVSQLEELLTEKNLRIADLETDAEVAVSFFSGRFLFVKICNFLNSYCFFFFVQAKYTEKVTHIH